MHTIRHFSIVFIILMTQLLGAEPYEIGRSAKGNPIEVTRIGNGNRIAICLVGGIHGDEANTSALVSALRERFCKYADGPEAVLPDDVTLYVLPVLNPDGLEQKTRRNDNNVDLNRNFATPNWKKNAPSPMKIVKGSGGVRAGSEPCTAAVAAWLIEEVKQKAELVFVISYHAAVPPKGAVQPGYKKFGQPVSESKRIARFVAHSLGYSYLFTWNSRYPLTGEFIHWCELNGIHAIDIELPNRSLTRGTIDLHVSMLIALLNDSALRTRS